MNPSAKCSGLRPRRPSSSSPLPLLPSPSFFHLLLEAVWTTAMEERESNQGRIKGGTWSEAMGEPPTATGDVSIGKGTLHRTIIERDLSYVNGSSFEHRSFYWLETEVINILRVSSEQSLRSLSIFLSCIDCWRLRFIIISCDNVGWVHL